MRPRALLSYPCAALLWLSSGRAEPVNTLEPARVYDWLRRYDVADSCPAEHDFRRALGERLERPLVEAFAQLRLEVKITADASGSGWAGQLSVKDETGTATTRELAGASCDSVFAALSLLAALSADGAPAPEPLPSFESVADTGVSPGAERERGGLRAGPAVWALLDSSVAPQLATGFGAGLRLEWRSDAAWSPELQFGALHLRSERQPAAGSVGNRFAVSALQTSFCPLRVLSSQTWSVRPCVQLEVGRISGQGVGPALVRSTERHGLWLSSGASLQGGAVLWGPLTLGAAVGATFPWVRHEFFLEPNTLVYRVPAVGWRAGASLTAHL
ncbi:MAG TPA: hypothetical protein VJU61_23935 [Polyangiaceae bacterium]|nr:hypothetical protein [Polyangiaceae bacterium]